MSAVKVWLWHPSWAGMLRICWLVITVLVLVEALLGRSKNKHWRSIGDSLRHLLGLFLGVVPGAGPVLVRFLQVLYVVPRDHHYGRKRKPEAVPEPIPSTEAITPPPTTVKTPTPVTAPKKVPPFPPGPKKPPKR